MNQELEKEIRKQIDALHFNTDMILRILNNDIPADIIKMHFSSIRILVDYCEKLAIEGEDAIEEL